VGALLAVAVFGGMGALALDRFVDRGESGVQTDGTTGVAPGSTSASTGGFPEDVPREGDAECSVPRTDPDRPGIAPTGDPADGVVVTNATVSDGDDGSVVFRAAVSAAPVVSASSASKWVLIELGGVRMVDADEVAVDSAHARTEKANLCDDSAWAFAYAFDARVTGLELVTRDSSTVEIVVRLSER
jgi:hypothetical protein